jgi:hypothetical protein
MKRFVVFLGPVLTAVALVGTFPAFVAVEQPAHGRQWRRGSQNGHGEVVEFDKLHLGRL